MKKKLSLDLLKVESFITTIEANISKTIAGGAMLSGNCHYDSEINGGGCVKSAFSDCALPAVPVAPARERRN